MVYYGEKIRNSTRTSHSGQSCYDNGYDRVCAVTFFICPLQEVSMSGSKESDHVKTYIEKLAGGIDPVTDRTIAGFLPSELPIPVTEFTRRVNGLIRSDAPIKKLCYKHMIQFLIHSGLLTEYRDRQRKIVRYPTIACETLGIKAEKREGIQGSHTAILYDRNAQQFLLDNMRAFVDIKNMPETD